jgi:hypothetical protein
MRTSRNVLATLLILAGAAACLQSREGPPLPEQSRVSYGPRIYLAERQGFPVESNNGICTRMTTTVETLTGGATTTPSTLQGLVDDANFTATDGLRPLDVATLQPPQTCFVPVVEDPGEQDVAGTLLVDRFEVTNDLFQFCIDSGFCAEPDPSNADQNDICSVEGQDDGFFDCPVVEVSLPEARRFCQYIGRRLPTAIESVMIRQAGWTAGADGTRSPEAMRLFPAEDQGSVPQGCEDAHLGSLGCGRPDPIVPGGVGAVGAAIDDDVIDDVLGGEPIYDLTGHTAEWATDGFPAGRQLPWFCLGGIDRDNAEGRPTCPELTPPEDTGGSDLRFRTGCVYGYYDPDELSSSVAVDMFGSPDDPAPGVDLPYGLYPVCAIGSSGRFSGRDGHLFGGSWKDAEDNTLDGSVVNPDLAGTFGFRVDSAPDELTDTLIAQRYGFRCVDDREPGFDENDEPFAFDSLLPGADAPGPQIDVDFSP